VLSRRVLLRRAAAALAITAAADELPGISAFVQLDDRDSVLARSEVDYIRVRS
jgi:hypothetical protein